MIPIIQRRHPVVLARNGTVEQTGRKKAVASLLRRALNKRLKMLKNAFSSTFESARTSKRKMVGR